MWPVAGLLGLREGTSSLTGEWPEELQGCDTKGQDVPGRGLEPPLSDLRRPEGRAQEDCRGPCRRATA